MSDVPTLAACASQGLPELLGSETENKMSTVRITVRIQGECNQQALFDVLAGQNRNLTAAIGFDRGGWTAVAFDADAGEKDWGKHLSSLFPDMRMSFDCAVN